MQSSRYGGVGLFTVALLLSALTGCTSESSTPTLTDGPAADLHAAMGATLAAHSFLADETTTFDPPSMGATSSANFAIQQPDREHVWQKTGESLESITIGGTSYLKVAGSPSRFEKTSCPGTNFTPSAVSYIMIVSQQARNVEYDGQTYAFDVPSWYEGSTGEATVSDGRLASLTLHVRIPTEDGVVQSTAFTYSAFNSDPKIEAPPADRVVEAHNPVVPCPSGSASASGS